MSAVWLDRSPGLLLACCADCPAVWRTAVDDEAEGWRQLAAHRAACHGPADPDRKNSVRNLRRICD